MSSNYYPICLNHNPALILHDIEWITPGDAEEAIKNRNAHDWLRIEHRQCDLLIARNSGNIIQIGCPATETCRHHRDIVWVDVCWIHLYGRALTGWNTHGIHFPNCWTEQRVLALAPLLEAAYA